jgi:hypothetical protein
MRNIVADGGGLIGGRLRMRHRSVPPGGDGRWRDSPALLAPGGVWLSGYASNNVSPDPPAAALLGTAQGWHGALPHAFELTLKVDRTSHPAVFHS